ncbi:MAG: NADH-quinone oxidoreductase subunit J [Pseudanabaenaceae cyanobacterium bins.68]|nr:NADH-quinone oxidoreductase subunit J [Pseudanabaenaceae cyanobacterium bins.68]
MNLSEGVQVVTLIILGAIITGAAAGVVLLPSVVYAAFLLGLVFLSMSGMYLLLNADFVAAAQILIYVGAVNVLILFAIMLVNRIEPYAKVVGGGLRNLVTGGVCAALFGLLVYTVTSMNWHTDLKITPLTSTITVLAKHFFSDYLLPFELVSVLLLMALIGAIILARREFVPEPGAMPNDTLELLERARETLVEKV